MRISQEELAALAFGVDSSRKNTIGALEGGSTANPQAKTIEALIRALDLTADEVAACDPATSIVREFERLLAPHIKRLSDQLDEVRAQLDEKASDPAAVNDATPLTPDPAIAAREVANDAEFDRALASYLMVASHAWNVVGIIGDWPRSGGTHGRWKLSDVYVRASLQIQTSRSLGIEGMRAEIHANQNKGADVGAQPETNATRLESIGHALASHDRVAVFGRAGIGKTCLLRGTGLAYAARWFAQEADWRRFSDDHGLLDDAVLPVLLDMGRLHAPGRDAHWGFLVEEAVRQLSPDLGDDAGRVTAAILHHIRSGRPTLLMIDSLDEITDEQDARRIVELADEAQHRHENLKVLLSTRWSRGRPLRGRAQTQQVELLDLGLAQRTLLLERLFRRAGESDVATRVAAALARLSEVPILARAARTPMFVEFLAADLPRESGVWDANEDSLAQTLLALLIDRRAATAGLMQYIGWEHPAGHVALHMVQAEARRIPVPDLTSELERAFAFISQSLPIGRKMGPDDYQAAMIASGVLREDTDDPARLRSSLSGHFEFVLDEIKDWLAVTALFEAWSPNGFGPENDIEGAISELMGSADFRIPYPRRDLLRAALLSMPEVAARRLLDRILSVPGAPENLTFVLQVMQAGRLPGSANLWPLVKTCCATAVPNDPHEVSEEVFTALRDDFGGPEAGPVAWATILGLYTDKLAGAATSLHSAINQRGWLSDPQLVDDIKARIAGDEPLMACAAMFEVLNWAFSSQLYVVRDAERATLEEIVDLLFTHVGQADSRADFAVWALNWIYMAHVAISPWIDAETIDQEAMIAAVGSRRMTSLGRRAAAGILSKAMRARRIDPQKTWLDSVMAGRLFADRDHLTLAPRHHPAAVDAVRAALYGSNEPYSRGMLALAAVELGADDQRTLDVATEFVMARAEYELHDRSVVAIATNGAAQAARHLTRLFSAEPERLRVSALMALLATSDRATVTALRGEPDADAWHVDIRTMIDEALSD